MTDIATTIIYWQMVTVGTLVIFAAGIWVSFKMLTYILKGLGVWRDTLHLLAFYYAVKRGSKSFKFNGKEYRKQDE